MYMKFTLQINVVGALVFTVFFRFNAQTHGIAALGLSLCVVADEEKQGTWREICWPIGLL